MVDPRVEVGIDAILKARAWRDPIWGDSAIGSFDYSTKEDGPCYVIRDHEAERREQKTVVLHKTTDREENEREYRRAVLRREITAMLSAMDAAAWQPIETAPQDGTSVLLYEGLLERIEPGWAYGNDPWQQDGLPPRQRITHWMPLPQPPECKV